MHEVVERRQTQQRDDSGCGVAQWGHRQTAMEGSSLRAGATVEGIPPRGERLFDDGQDLPVG